jgi:NADH-quinone oxidoreductase subunit M
MPVYAAILGFFVMASIGLPGLAGFVGEFLVFLGTFAFFPWAAAIAVLVIIFGAVYLLWMYQRLFFGEVSDFLKGLGHHLVDMSPIEVLTLAPLAILTLALGVYPALVLDFIQVPVNEFLARGVLP